MTSHRSSQRLARVAAATAVLAFATAAFGQTTADKEQAKVLVVEGRQLRDEKNDHKGAVERFQAAYKLVKTPIIGLDLARERAALGELVEAYGVCDEIDRLPTKDTESAESKQARGTAATLGAELGARIPKLSIKLKAGHAEAPKPTVVLDGTELAPQSLLVPRVVNPGKHTLVVRVDGATPTSTTVTVAEGTTEDVALEVPVVASSHHFGLRTTGLVVSGAGLLALGVGGALAFSAKSKANGASCDASNVCSTPADVEQRHAAVQQANVATAVVGVGAVLAVGGAVLWLIVPSRKADEARSAGTGVTKVGVGHSGLVIDGRF